jgi:hypothetical protein
MTLCIYVYFLYKSTSHLCKRSSKLSYQSPKGYVAYILYTTQCNLHICFSIIPDHAVPKKWLNAISNHLPPGRVHERAHLISHAGGFSDASAKPMTCVVNKPNKTCIKHLHILPTWVCDVIGHREYYFSIMIFGVPSCTLHQVFFFKW